MGSAEDWMMPNFRQTFGSASAGSILVFAQSLVTFGVVFG